MDNAHQRIPTVTYPGDGYSALWKDAAIDRISELILDLKKGAKEKNSDPRLLERETEAFLKSGG